MKILAGLRFIKTFIIATSLCLFLNSCVTNCPSDVITTQTFLLLTIREEAKNFEISSQCITISDTAYFDGHISSSEQHGLEDGAIQSLLLTLDEAEKKLFTESPENFSNQDIFTLQLNVEPNRWAESQMTLEGHEFNTTIVMFGNGIEISHGPGVMLKICVSSEENIAHATGIFSATAQHPDEFLVIPFSRPVPLNEPTLVYSSIVRRKIPHPKKT